MEGMLVCKACGRTPAALVSIRRHVGMLVMQRFVKLRVPLCRQCGEQLVKSYTQQTLWQGWWGLISFFVNWFVLASNLVTLRTLRKLDEPRAVSAAAEVASMGVPGPVSAP